MKKVLVLSGLFLCAAGAFATETRTESISEGKKRNEEAFEKLLEQTGWKIPATTSSDKKNEEGARQRPKAESRGV